MIETSQHETTTVEGRSGDQSLLGRIVSVEDIDATEMQFTYEDGRVVRLYAQDPDGFWAWLLTYKPESTSEPSLASAEDDDLDSDDA